MKVIVIEGLSAQLGGGPTYLVNLLSNIPDVLVGKCKIVAILSSTLARSIRPSETLEFVTPAIPRYLPFGREIWMLLHLPRIVNQLGADVVYSAGGFLPIAVMSNLKLKLVVAFRNMLVFDQRERSRYGFSWTRLRLWLLGFVQSHSFRYADLIIFVSEYGRDVVNRDVPERIGHSIVIPHGVPEEFKERRKARPENVKEFRYVLYVSIIDAYKSQIEVVSAWAKLRAKRTTCEKLVLLGPEYRPYAARLRKHIKSLGLEDEVIFLGQVTHSAIAAYMQHAELNLFASTCENCPNILLELMAAGRPVLCSNAAPMPEFGGDGVEYFDVSRPDLLAELLTQYLDSGETSERMGRAALRQSRRFSAVESAHRTWLTLSELAFRAEVRIANVIEDGRVGGPQLRMLQVADQLLARGISTVLIVPRRASSELVSMMQERNVPYLTANYVTPGRKIGQIGRYLIWFSFDVCRLWIMLRLARINLVHASGGAWQSKAVLAGKLAGRPVIWHLNDTLTYPLVYWLFQRLGHRLPHGFIVAGERVRNYYFLTLPTSKPIWHIPAPVDTQRFNPEAVDALDFPRARRSMVTVGNLNPIKGHDRLIQAIKYLESFGVALNIYFVGPILETHPQYFEELKRLAETLSVSRVHFVGAMADVRPYLKAADLYVCSSLVEASPMSVWEAMSMECSIVSTDVGDVSVYVRDGESGFVVPNNDFRALGDAIWRILKDEKQALAMGRRAREIAVGSLDVSIIASRHEDCYRQALGLL